MAYSLCAAQGLWRIEYINRTWGCIDNNHGSLSHPQPWIWNISRPYVYLKKCSGTASRVISNTASAKDSSFSSIAKKPKKGRWDKLKNKKSVRNKKTLIMDVVTHKKIDALNSDYSIIAIHPQQQVATVDRTKDGNYFEYTSRLSRCSLGTDKPGFFLGCV